MTALLVEPHLDDAVLFASYTILGEKPIVATCLARTPEGPRRLDEHFRALALLGVRGDDRHWLMEPERAPDWKKVLEWMRALRRSYEPSHVYAPAVEVCGHEEHNGIGNLASEAFPSVPITSYMTYRRGGRRSQGSTEISPGPGMAALKLQAMACYTSQIEREATRPWFAADDALREWYA